ncbi:MAG: hypothetical protein LBQ05_00395 [Christensenellaceae bacterium]|jgi:uncharacterized coiled-coil protein SlyX|nr:hypothetical protein [Christensenellaceae bacterium]
MKTKFKKIMVVGLTALTSIGMMIGLTGCGEEIIIGRSAYDVAVDNGFEGTEAEWLASLKGTDGTNGTSGDIYTIGDDGYWYKNGVITGTKAEGEDGADGSTQNLMVDSNGKWILNGDATPYDAKGQSAYEIYVSRTGDNTLDESAWLEAYVKGKSAFKVWAEAQPANGGRTGGGTVNGYNMDDFLADIEGSSAFEIWANLQTPGGKTGDGVINGYDLDDFFYALVGNGIESIEKHTDGNVDTYTINYKDGEPYQFTVTNGVNGKSAFEQWAETRPTPGDKNPEIAGVVNGYNFADFYESLNGTFTSRVTALETGMTELEDRVEELENEVDELKRQVAEQANAIAFNNLRLEIMSVGRATITETMTVPAGASLVIFEATTLTIADGATLIVYGTLINHNNGAINLVGDIEIASGGLFVSKNGLDGSGNVHIAAGAYYYNNGSMIHDNQTVKYTFDKDCVYIHDDDDETNMTLPTTIAAAQAQDNIVYFINGENGLFVVTEGEDVEFYVTKTALGDTPANKLIFTINVGAETTVTVGAEYNSNEKYLQITGDGTVDTDDIPDVNIYPADDEDE